MIRIFRVCVALVFIGAVLLGNAAWAGDSDGITGYSMQLKNKSISTGDQDGIGGSAVYVAPKEQQIASPYATETIRNDQRWFVSIPFRFAAFVFWMR